MFSNLQFISLWKQPGVIQRWLDSLSVLVSTGCVSRLGIVLGLAAGPLGKNHRAVPFWHHTQSGGIEPVLYYHERKGVDEMAQLVKELVTQAQRPEFDPRDPHQVAA